MADRVCVHVCVCENAVCVCVCVCVLCVCVRVLENEPYIRRRDIHGCLSSRPHSHSAYVPSMLPPSPRGDLFWVFTCFSPPNGSAAGHAVPVPLVLWQDEASLHKAAPCSDAPLIAACVAERGTQKVSRVWMPKRRVCAKKWKRREACRRAVRERWYHETHTHTCTGHTQR